MKSQSYNLLGQKVDDLMFQNNPNTYGLHEKVS